SADPSSWAHRAWPVRWATPGRRGASRRLKHCSPIRYTTEVRFIFGCAQVWTSPMKGHTSPWLTKHHHTSCPLIAPSQLSQLAEALGTHRRSSRRRPSQKNRGNKWPHYSRPSSCISHHPPTPPDPPPTACPDP